MITDYAIPTAASSPEGIAAGPDGNLWFTESAVGKVAHFAPATPGTIAERALGSATSQPIGITGGPDGKIWFAEYGSGLIGKLTTNGVTLIEHSLPTANSHPVDITVGPDQALWFSEFSAQQLGRISTIGNVFEVTTNPPTNSGPVGVAGGSDGNLWYTDYAAGRVGRLGLGAASGSIPWHPSYTVHPAAGLSVSVDLFDGHAQVRAAGMGVPGRGIVAALGRTWDSTLEQQGVVTPAGEGWVADTLVGMSTPGTLTGAVFYGDAGGASWEFDYLGLPGDPGPTYTTYSTPPGLPWRLTTNSGSTIARYILTNILDGATQTFDAGGALVGQADSYGQGNSLVYAGGLVMSIANGSGRALKVGYDTTSGLLNDVQSPLWQSSGPSKGQHVAYLYGGTGCTGVELCSVTWAQGAADARTVGFGYTNRALTGITTGRSGQWVAGASQWVLGYDGQGRVITITAPAAGTPGQPGYTPAFTTVIGYTPGSAVVSEGMVPGGGGSYLATAGTLVTTYTLSGQGEVVAVADAQGHTTSYAYDADHDVLSSTDPNAHQTARSYSYVGALKSAGLLTGVTLPPIALGALGATATPVVLGYRYDTNNNLIEADNRATGSRRVYFYSGLHHDVTAAEELSQITGSLGCPQISQQEERRVAILSIGQPLAEATPGPDGSTAADPAAGVDQSQAVQPASCIYTYHWRGRINTIDATGLLTASVDGRGVAIQPVVGSTRTPTTTPGASSAQYTSRWGYQPNGDPASASGPPVTVVPAPSATPIVLAPTAVYTFDGDGNRTAVQLPNGVGSTYVYGYDHQGRVTGVTQPSVAVVPAGTATPFWQTSYDLDGNIHQTIDPASDQTTFSYDPWQRPYQTQDPVGGSTVRTYSATRLTGVQDAAGRVTTYSYDGVGRLLSQTGPAGDATHDPGQLQSGYQYDMAGNPTQVAWTDGAATGTPTPLRLETRQYDAQNELAQSVVNGPGLGTGLTTSNAYDGFGNLAQQQAPNGDLTYHFYDLVGQPTVTALLPAASATASTEEYGFDKAGNPTSRKDFNGQIQTWTPDGLNRVTGELDSGTGGLTISASSQYDPNGNTVGRQVVDVLSTATPTSTATYTLAVSYNNADWPVQSTDNGLQTQAGYDAAGRLRSLSLPIPTPSGTPLISQVLYNVDGAGRATAVVEGPVAEPTYVAGFGYNPDNQLTGETLPGGVQAGATIDGAGRLIGLALSGPTATGTATPVPLLSSYDYHYDVLGRTSQSSGTVNGATTSWQAVTHDAGGRLTGATVNGVAQLWSYDGNNNLLTPVAGGVTTTYSYDPAHPNQLSSVQPAGGATVGYSGYDANGNPGMIANGTPVAQVNLTYDAQARLSGYFRADGGGATVRYEATGQRAGYTWHVPGTGNTPSYAVGFSYRGGQLAQLSVQPTPVGTATAVPAECNPNDPQGCAETFVYRQDGAPLELLYTPSKNNLTQRYWYSLDGRGNVVALTDASGQVVDRYHYDVWGVPTIDLERVPQPLLYAGYVYDREFHGPGEASGWYWLSVRHYDPALGRHPCTGTRQPDPSEQEGVRSYAYAGDDPLDATDPSGLGPFGTCVPYFESCRLPTGDEARRVGYGVANEAAGGLDVVSFGAFSHVAGAVGARVDTNSAAYLAGALITRVAPTAASLGTDPAADVAVGAGSRGVLARPAGLLK